MGEPDVARSAIVPSSTKSSDNFQYFNVQPLDGKTKILYFLHIHNSGGIRLVSIEKKAALIFPSC